jgi:hypothetical protein
VLEKEKEKEKEKGVPSQSADTNTEEDPAVSTKFFVDNVCMYIIT